MYEWNQIGFFLIVYSFLGWCAETLIYSFTRRRYVNAGFLTLPFILTYGITMVLLAGVLPSMGDNLPAQFIYTLIVSATTDRLGNFFVSRLTGISWPDRGGIFGGTLKGLIGALVLALGYFLTYQILHPMVIFVLPFLSILPLRLLSDAVLVLILADLIISAMLVRSGKYRERKEGSQSAKLTNLLTDSIWNRLEKTYPGVREMNAEEQKAAYTFGKGLSLDKVIWVFLLSALLGDLIETLWCRLIGGTWMSRSSVLYGPFSFVWGIGAVVLTISLLPLAKKNDRWVFLGGFFIGGAYEYLCSVFTEIVFGTVFWDYSHMPLNIGGRTNVLFMCFWGILSVVWIKTVYPKMSDFIEKLPPLTGKLITWVVIAAMLLNGALTVMAMLRYNVRKQDPAAHSRYEMFLDAHYPDERIENRWPNTIVVDE